MISAPRTSHFASPELVFERAKAAYLGLAIGDALGATTEFMTPGEIKAKYKQHRKIVGGGWLYLKPGQVTDDTEMSLALGKALLLAGRWDLKGIADHFLGWMKSKPIDIGATCRRGIRDYMLKGQLEVPYNEWDAGNGAAMRMAPVALFTLGDDELLRDYAVQQAHLTHNHALSDAASIVIGRLVQQGVLGADRHALHATTRQLVEEYGSFRFNNYRGNAGSYVVDTMQTVFHYLFTTSSFEECLVGVVNQGGDADTTGAIAGMIAGAFYGCDAIPHRWLKKLNKDVRTEVETQAEQLVKLSPWAKIEERGKRLRGYGTSPCLCPLTPNLVLREKTMSEQMMPLEEAAKALKTTPLNILMHVKRGMLVGVEEEGAWMIDKNSLDALIAKTGGSKADGVCASGCAKKHACGGGCG